MYLSTFVALATLSAGLDGVTALAADQKPVQTLNATVASAKRFIVEFADGADHQAVLSDLKARNGTRIIKTFQSDVFSGASVETTEDNLDTLRAIGPSSAAQVWSSNKIYLDRHIPTRSFSDDASASNYSVHNSTGVDMAHAAGYFGKGAVVAIVDTGTQYTHPALGGGFGPGYKVAGGYDFVGDSYWPIDGYSKQPDSDPLDSLGHGTHVAGIVAGKTDNFVGVAPEATLLSYKVFGRVDGTDEDTLIEAFLTAYNDGADIITSSIGGAGGWSTDVWATVASRLVEQGVVVTIAAGNNGQEGPFFGSNGAAGDYVLAVASVEASTLVAAPFDATFTLDGASNTTRVAYTPGWDAFPASVEGWPIVPLALNTSVVDDACSELPSTAQNLSADYPTSDTNNIPVYGGKILISGSNGEQLAIPYFGVASSLEKDLRKQFQKGYPIGQSGVAYPYASLDEHSSFTFDLSRDKQDFPRISRRTHWGVKELRWDIFDSSWNERDWKYPPVVGKDGYVGTVAYYSQSGNVNVFDPDSGNATDTISFPLRDIYRSAVDVYDAEYWWFGQLGNGSRIAKGDYTLRFAVLAPFGTPEHSDNWDVLGHKFSVV